MFETSQITLKNIFENISEISLITDFWISREQYGYIGVTVHWISDDYNPKEAFKKQNHNEDNSQNINKILFNNDIQDKILEKFEKIPDSKIANIIEINENGSKKKLNISRPIEIKGLVLLFLEMLNGLLKKYWLVSSDIGFLVTLLDSRSKKLVYFTENKEENENKRENENKDKNQDDVDLDKFLLDSIFRKEDSCNEEENEVDIYLKFKSNRNINPLSWSPRSPRADIRPRYFLGADNEDEIEAILLEHESHSLHEFIDGNEPFHPIIDFDLPIEMLNTITPKLSYSQAKNLLCHTFRDICLEAFSKWDKKTVTIAKSSDVNKISLHILTFGIRLSNIS
ncbi:hypothetical protein C1645_813138 [Glomus cerebriforme]|uniref:Uncharacterized protein n=1 Tax=Glomus cerebriforme TaxID=658196 RepID=A0A397TNN9_9GLOM|nr:hypothetical protein C1645_813138 [Glomus cerebriforme]